MWAAGLFGLCRARGRERPPGTPRRPGRAQGPRMHMESPARKKGRQMEEKLPAGVLRILGRLQSSGHEAYVVGGCVRDALRRAAPHDWDICTSALPQQVMALFPRQCVRATGLKHGTVTVLQGGQPYEVTTFRIEAAYSDGRHPDSVRFTKSLAADLARRDFTINAMAYSPQSGLVDLFHGREDLQNGVIRCVGNATARLEEDALRVLRALRFSATLGFSIAPETAAAIHRHAGGLAHVSAGRICAELRRLVTGPGAGRVLLQYQDVVAQFLPETNAMAGFWQHNPHHIYTVWGHTAAAVGASAPDEAVRLALLFHDMAKPQCFTRDAAGTGHFYGHAQAGSALCRQAMRRLQFDSETVRLVSQLVLYHDTVLVPQKPAVRRWLNKIGQAQFCRLLAVHRGDTLGLAPALWPQRLAALQAVEDVLAQVLKEEACFSRKALAVNGRDIMALGVPQGRQVGEVLHKLLQCVLEGRLPNERQALLAYAKGLVP